MAATVLATTVGVRRELYTTSFYRVEEKNNPYHGKFSAPVLPISD